MADTVKLSPLITDETLERFGFKEHRIRADEGELAIYCDHDKGGARSAAIEIDVPGWGGCCHDIRVRPPQTEDDLRELLYWLNIKLPSESAAGGKDYQ